MPCVWIWVKNNTNLTPIGRHWWLLLNILNKMKNIQASFNSSLHSKHKTYLSCVCRLVSVTDETLCIISPLMNGCVQWTVNHATTRRKTKKGYISCIENKLYLSKMQVGKHLLFLSSMRIVTVYASISITHECHRNISMFTVINMTSKCAKIIFSDMWSIYLSIYLLDTSTFMSNFYLLSYFSNHNWVLTLYFYSSIMLIPIITLIILE